VAGKSIHSRKYEIFWGSFWFLAGAAQPVIGLIKGEEFHLGFRVFLGVGIIFMVTGLFRFLRGFSLK
jgi:hypothetical protein